MRSDNSSCHSRYFLSLSPQLISHSSFLPLTLTLKIYKGLQKLDQTTESLVCPTLQTQIKQFNLSNNLKFYHPIPDSNKTHNHNHYQYRILVENANVENSNQLFIKETDFDIRSIVDEYEMRGRSKMERKLKIDDTLSITFVVLIEKTKGSLSKSISSLSSNSIHNKCFTEPNKSLNLSFSPSSDTQSINNHKTTRTLPSVECTSLSISKTSQYAQQSYQNQQQELPELKLLIQKEWSQKLNHGDHQIDLSSDLDNDLDSISVVESNNQKKKSRTEGKRKEKLHGKFILVSSILFLVLFCYFIVTIEDQQSQLAVIGKILRERLGQRQEVL